MEDLCLVYTPAFKEKEKNNNKEFSLELSYFVDTIIFYLLKIFNNSINEIYIRFMFVAIK